jgi:hypothetical protein
MPTPTWVRRISGVERSSFLVNEPVPEKQSVQHERELQLTVNGNRSTSKPYSSQSLKKSLWTFRLTSSELRRDSICRNHVGLK